VTLAEGWPYVAVTARRPATARMGTALTGTGTGTGELSTTATGTTFGVSAPRAAVTGRDVTLPKGSTAVLYAVPQGVDAALLAAGARRVVTAGTAEGALTAKTATTTLRYRTSGGTPTVLASRPGTHPTGVTCTAGPVRTISGSSTLCRGTTATTAVPPSRPTTPSTCAAHARPRRRAIGRPERPKDTTHGIRVCGDRRMTDPATTASHELAVNALTAKKSLRCLPLGPHCERGRPGRDEAGHPAARTHGARDRKG
jgi:hypothetical protein